MPNLTKPIQAELRFNQIKEQIIFWLNNFFNFWLKNNNILILRKLKIPPF